MKITASRIQILETLADDGNAWAEELLGESVQPSLLTRCQTCPGCRTFNEEGPCEECPGCLAEEECSEYQRCCFKWEKRVDCFHDRSNESDESFHFDLEGLDLSRHRDLVEDLGNVCMDLESAVDKFPADQERAKHPRYGVERIEMTMEYEEVLLTLIEDLVDTQIWEKEHLKGLEDGTEDEEY